MLYFLIIVVALIGFGSVSHVVKRRRLAELQAMFVRYNLKKDPLVITTWIEEGNAATRLVDVMDYLQKIEEDDLLLHVYDALGFDRFTNRHIRILACRAYAKTNQSQKALLLAQRLLETYPQDDSILDLFIDVHLLFGEEDKVRPLLMKRLDRKFKGTTFPKHYARLAAADGDFEKAITIMENVVHKDYVLYKNTLAPLSKRLIHAQYKADKNLLESLQAKASGQKEPGT